MTAPHRHVREELGAYVLGALEPAERQAVDAHLADCDTCRDELSRLSNLPGLLNRLSADEASDDRLVPSPDLAPRVVLSAAAEAGRLRRHLVWWRAAAASGAAASVALLLLLAPWEPEPDRLVAAAEPVAAAAAATEGTAAAIAWEWGTTVELDVRELPERPWFALYTVADDGRREQAGAWGATGSSAARVRGATAIQRGELDRVEIVDGAGEVLVAFDF